jgi:RHS repeat-associated protein
VAAISTTASGYSDAWFDYRADGMRAREYYEAVGGGAASGPAGGAATMGAPFGELHRERLHRYDGQMPMEVVTREGPGMAVASVRRHALGARGIDRVETWTPSSGTDVAYPVYDGHGNRIQALRRGQFAGGVPADMPAGGRTDPWGVFNGGRGHAPAAYCANLGHPTDAETGLVYMRARYYEPWTGRFLSEDPAMDGRNWYVYCGNDPVVRVDYTAREDINEFTGDILLHMGVAASLCAVALMFAGGRMNSLSSITMSAVAVVAFGFYFEGRSKWSFGGSIANLMLTSVTMRAMLSWAASVALGPNKGGRGYAALAVAATYTYSLALWGALLAIEFVSEEFGGG